MSDSASAGESQPHIETTAAAAANPTAVRFAAATSGSDPDLAGPDLLPMPNRSSDKGAR